MHFELRYRTLRQELIRTFAHADELLDQIADDRITNTTHTNILPFESIITDNQTVLSSIGNYKLLPIVSIDWSPSVDACRIQRAAQFFQQCRQFIKPAIDFNDYDAIREILRDQLYETLILHDLLYDKENIYVIKLRGADDEIELDVFSLIHLLTEQMQEHLGRSSKDKKSVFDIGS